MHPIKATSIYVFVEWHLVMFFLFLSLNTNSCGGCPIKYRIESKMYIIGALLGCISWGLIQIERERGKYPKHLYIVFVLFQILVGFLFLHIDQCSSYKWPSFFAFFSLSLSFTNHLLSFLFHPILFPFHIYFQ